MNLHNQHILVTGASSGIGEACVRLFAQSGAVVTAVARRMEKLEALKHDLREAPGSVEIVELDVTAHNDVKRVLEPVLQRRPVDVLINNAGKSRGLGPLHEGLVSDWEEMIDTNVKGLLYVSRTVLPHMVQRDAGMVINIGSIAGREVYPGGNVYCATKHAVKALSDGMRIDTVHSRVRVCNIDPGLVETEFAEVRFHGDKSKAEAVYEGYTPLRANDIAEACLFCATRPPHVTVADMLLFSVDQATSTIVHKQ